MTSDLRPDRWGLHLDWVDARGERCTVPTETVRVLRAVICEPPADLESRAPIVTRPGRDLGLGKVAVACEDGETRHVDGRLPADFPLGYHRLRTSEGIERRLIVSPGRCWLPEDRRAWGWAVQLYATRSRNSWGIGELADLRAVREWAESLGAGFLMVNPLHAVAPTHPLEASPYLPATRRFRNPIYLRIADVPGAGHIDLSAVSADGTALNDHRLIDRDAAWELKHAALRQLFDVREDWADFEAWRDDLGRSLHDFATWCALVEEHGPDWREWPADLKHPDGDAVSTFAEKSPERVDFHAWLQWLLDRQLHAATGELPVIQDLPIGVAGGGADAWAWQDTLARGVTAGAPPDIFNAAGQSWGSPPFTPWRLRAADYQPFIESIRATMAGAGGLRVDHVMGLFRLWWVPDGMAPGDGAYVRYPSEDLLDIVALESHRARSIVVGEDLGTVDPGVRETLAERGMLSYKLLWFEQDEPRKWPVSAMAAVTTHDLPTVAGLWTGRDVDDQARWTSVALTELERGREELLSQLRGMPASATPADAVEAAYRLLAQSPCAMVAATLEDAVVEEQRPNLPGTVDRPNWCRALPVSVEDLPTHPTAAVVADVLRNGVMGKRR